MIIYSTGGHEVGVDASMECVLVLFQGTGRVWGRRQAGGGGRILECRESRELTPQPTRQMHPQRVVCVRCNVSAMAAVATACGDLRCPPTSGFTQRSSSSVFNDACNVSWRTPPVPYSWPVVLAWGG